MNDVIKKQIFSHISATINHSQNILLVTHLSPDGDALGALSSFYLYLRQLGKNTRLFVADNISAEFNFLPLIDRVENNWRNFLTENFDLIVMLDCGDERRAGLAEYFATLSKRPTIINIDHHASNNNFGAVNLVDLNSSSTSEILTEFFLSQPIVWHRDLSTALLFGIVSDTGFFAHSSTTQKTMLMVAELLQRDANLNTIVPPATESASLNGLKIWGKALSRLIIDPLTGLAVTAIFLDDLENQLADRDDLNGLSGFLNSLNDVPGVLVLKEVDGNQVKGSLRTTRDDVDVSVMAREFGGGGHAKAAGFITTGRIIKTENGVWQIEKI